jgi:hypothetical protein
VPAAFSLGPVSPTQECGQAAHAVGRVISLL